MLQPTTPARNLWLHTLSEKRVLSRTLKVEPRVKTLGRLKRILSMTLTSAGIFKGSRWNPLEMVLGGTLPEEP